MDNFEIHLLFGAQKSTSNEGTQPWMSTLFQAEKRVANKGVSVNYFPNARLSTDPWVQLQAQSQTMSYSFSKQVFEAVGLYMGL